MPTRLTKRCLCGGSWPDYFHGREYQMGTNEATLIDPPSLGDPQKLAGC